MTNRTIIKKLDINEQNIYSNIISFIISFSVSLLNRTINCNFIILIISIITVIISLINEKICEKFDKINNRIYSNTSLVQLILIFCNNILFINKKIVLSDIFAYFIIFLYYINNYFL